VNALNPIGTITWVDIALDIVKAIPIFLFIVVVVRFITKKLYSIMVSRGMRENVAVYYNRKIIHILSGGLAAILVPFLFVEPFAPMILAYTLALATYLPHKTGRLLRWFQVKENMYEVNFCIAWGTSLVILWLLTGDPWISIIPAIAISFGDAITGVVRNKVFGRRTKHWIGNVAMAILTIPIGYIIDKWAGVTAMIGASIIERVEYNPIDDNLLIAFTATAILLIWHFLL